MRLMPVIVRSSPAGCSQQRFIVQPRRAFARQGLFSYTAEVYFQIKSLAQLTEYVNAHIVLSILNLRDVLI